MSDNSESFEDKYYNSNRTIHKLWKDIDEINQKLQAAEEENRILREAVEFYATFTPYQFPEGYYEICIEEGMGGHNKFGTIARQALEKVEGGE